MVITPKINNELQELFDKYKKENNIPDSSMKIILIDIESTINSNLRKIVNVLIDAIERLRIERNRE